MLTQIITILILVSIVGCILYGRRLIKTEKVDAVFGNPERAKGGTHWIIVGSSAILLIWLYYSWDIAKGFYPKSANELCQVAKVNESLLGLKYQFPIEEREFKSTSIIKIENKNLKKITNELRIPTIGIGSSIYCDGQILVTDDMLGISGFSPKFVKKYVKLDRIIEKAIKKYTRDVKSSKFPSKKNFLNGSKRRK